MRIEWLEEGYVHFAKAGPENISINQIGKNIGASRSSFYHHFGDPDFFIDELLALHWEACQEFDKAGKQHCKKLIPDLYRELAKHPVSLQFHIQLFRHRNRPHFNYLFLKSYESSAKSFALRLFAAHFDLNLPEKMLYNLWLTLGEAWYSRLDLNDVSAPTLERQGKEVLKSIAFFMDSNLFRRLEK